MKKKINYNKKDYIEKDYIENFMEKAKEKTWIKYYAKNKNISNLYPFFQIKLNQKCFAPIPKQKIKIKLKLNK